ncbi:hypothetical protein ABMA28_000438 [Loxostege sticticalis]|uniref:Uncharacterized protein n=1 Tax=Loxostege sticticalis TaxID=481309 RepID=A0ABD0TSN9_LOXSC
MAFSALLLVLLTSEVLSAPADEPIRVDLPVYDQPGQETYQLAQPLEPENYGGYQQEKSQNGLTGLFDQKPDHGELKPEVPAGTVNEQGGNGWFAPPVTTLEGALLETEGIGSKKISVKDNLHQVVAGLFQPKPVVDTIKEEEKYGNHGDKFYNVGRAVVSGAEGVSNFVNSVLEVPGSIIKKIARATSEKLNNLGGRLIGL